MIKLFSLNYKSYKNFQIFFFFLSNSHVFHFVCLNVKILVIKRNLFSILISSFYAFQTFLGWHFLLNDVNDEYHFWLLIRVQKTQLGSVFNTNINTHT